MTEQQERIKYAIDNMFVSQICKITSINGNGTVNIKVNELQKFSNEVYHANRCEISNVPVAKFKYGAFSVDTPVKAGDNVLVLFCDGNIETELFQQSDDSRHCASNAIVIAGLEGINSNKPFDNKFVIRHNDVPKFSINSSGSEIEINANLKVVGNIECSDTVTASNDVIGGGISLKSHVHGGVQGGNAKTSVPE